MEHDLDVQTEANALSNKNRKVTITVDKCQNFTYLPTIVAISKLCQLSVDCVMSNMELLILYNNPANTFGYNHQTTF